MCNESIKACAVVLGVCAVPTLCQTLIITRTPAACLQFSPGCFFSCWISLFLVVCRMGDALSAEQLSALEQLPRAEGLAGGEVRVQVESPW